MKIAGIQKLSLVDFDGHISSTIFTSGCNFACAFCHNSSLIPNSNDLLKIDDVLNFLNKRKNMLDSVCITGGEPTLHKDLPEFISKIKEMGYLVKLDTNGTNPEMIQYLVENKLIDYIAMDIKNIPEKYTVLPLPSDEASLQRRVLLRGNTGGRSLYKVLHDHVLSGNGQCPENWQGLLVFLYEEGFLLRWNERSA